MGQLSINLTFHGVGEPKRRLDPAEAEFWLGRRQFESTLDSVAGRSDVRITFDDGNHSDLAYALPALRKRGLTATFFVVGTQVAAHPDLTRRIFPFVHVITAEDIRRSGILAGKEETLDGSRFA